MGGARVHAKLVKPTNYEGKRPAVLEFHGYSGNCGGFAGKLAYACAGFVVAALDARGQGGYSEDPIPVKGTTQNATSFAAFRIRIPKSCISAACSSIPRSSRAL